MSHCLGSELKLTGTETAALTALGTAPSGLIPRHPAAACRAVLDHVVPPAS
jgi:hypothetical protein